MSSLPSNSDITTVRTIDLTSTDVVSASAVPTTWFDNLQGSGDTLERNKEEIRNYLFQEILGAYKNYQNCWSCWRCWSCWICWSC